MFTSLALADYRRYAVGALASNVGTWMHRIGQSWLILALTGDATMLGISMALQFLPMLLVGPWAGVLADRSDRRRLLMLTQAALALQALALGLVVLAGAATAPLVLGAALLLGVITAIDAPARQSIVSDLVGPGRVVNAVSLNSASFNAARLVGPAIAGVVIAVAGTGWVFVVNSLTFLFMLGALSRISPRAAQPAGRARGGVRAGLRHVRRHADLLFVTAVAGLVSMFALNFQLNIAVMATDEFGAGPVAYGVLASVMAVGSLAGALLAARRGRTSVRIVAAAAGGLSLATIAAGLMPDVWTFGAALVACGLFALTMMTAANSYLQTHAGAEHRSRVMALYLAIFFGTTPVGAPLVGWMTEQWGPRAGMVLPGVLALAGVIGLAAAYRSRQGQRRTGLPDSADRDLTPRLTRA